MEKLTTLHEVKRETLDRLKELSEFNLSNFIEIAQNAMQSRYSPTQLISFKNSGICLSYMGTPIIASGGSQTESGYSFLFTYATMQTSSMSMTFHKMIVYPDLSITAATELMETAVTRLPLAVNGKKFTTADEITLVAGDIQAESGWSPTDDKDLATKKYVDDNGGGITEKVLELPLDWEVAGASNGLYTTSGSEIFLMGDQTGTGGLLHNARITGIEVEVAQSVWYNAFAVIPTGVIPVVLTMPVAVTLDGDDYTIILVTPAAVSQLEDALSVRIHYIELDGIETVTT